MLLSRSLELYKEVENYRNRLHVLYKSKELNNPEIVRTSQELDKIMIKLQKITFDVGSKK